MLTGDAVATLDAEGHKERMQLTVGQRVAATVEDLSTRQAQTKELFEKWGDTPLKDLKFEILCDIFYRL